MSFSTTSNEPFEHRFVLKNARQEIEQAERAILEAIERLDFGASCSFGIRLALEEALSNAFKHGNQEDPGKTVNLDCRISPGRIEIEVEDQGFGFDPTAVPDPTEQENVEIPAGRGLMLMRSFMTSVTILPPGNRVQMVYVSSG